MRKTRAREQGHREACSQVTALAWTISFPAIIKISFLKLQPVSLDTDNRMTRAPALGMAPPSAIPGTHTQDLMLRSEKVFCNYLCL